MEPLTSKTSLAEMIELARKAIDGWPNDVRAALGIDPRASSEPTSPPVAWRKALDPQYDYSDRYRYRDETGVGAAPGWEPLYAEPRQPPEPSRPSPALYDLLNVVLPMLEGKCPVCGCDDLHSALVVGNDGVSCGGCDWGMSYAWIKDKAAALGYSTATKSGSEPPDVLHAFKNFHRLLCERFDYCHDEKDWQRDQLSLIEWIAKRTAQPPRAQLTAIESMLGSEPIHTCVDNKWHLGKLATCPRCSSVTKRAECEHDLLKPNTTVIADGRFDARCTVCREEWHIPHPTKGEPRE